VRTPRFVDWTRGVLYRVVRRGWKDPLDTSFSRRSTHRWNTPEFEALYCCASAKVARAVALDVFRLAGLVLEDLRTEHRPQLVEIAWRGRLVDVATPQGVRAAGFPARYPEGVGREATQAAGSRWHAAGFEGVLCRSASLARLRFAAWSGDPANWSEAAIYPSNAREAPRLVRRIRDLAWLKG
jgi:RES domain-containing protein